MNARIVLTLIALFPAATIASMCPFCAAVKQTLRQEFESMDAVAIGEIEATDGKATEIDGNAKFRILKIVKGAEHVRVDQVIEASYFGPSKTTKHFLLMGVDPEKLLWSSPIPITAKAEAYLEKVPTLPDDTLERLKFFQDYLEDEDTLLARDAYDEFAIAPYEQVKALKPAMNRKQIIAWVEDDKMTADRKRLYYTMLGVCGEPGDADLLEKRLKSDKAEAKTGLDALIACYLTLKGDSGLPLIEDLFLKNQKSQYAETYSAIMALRFHGTEGGVLQRDKIVLSLHHLLERPELADLVIPDLARWEDWSQIDRMVELFKNADESSSWVRVPVINYLRSCPLPKAGLKLEELEKIDPKAIQRAKTFFPLPAAQPSKGDSSMKHGEKGGEVLAKTDSEATTDRQLAFAGGIDALGVNFGAEKGLPLGQVPMNRLMLASVGSLAAFSLAIAMWLILSKSESGQMGLIVVRTETRETILEERRFEV